MKSEKARAHPADRWIQDAQQPGQSSRVQLRLAAMAGHIRLDKVAARRAALIDMLADGCPHPREEIWEVVAKQVDADCWGKLPHEALARDLLALRLGGIQIAYSRRPGAAGYYLQQPSLARSRQRQFETINWEWVKRVGQLSVPEKNERAFAAADFALTQKRLILAEENPAWSAAEVDREARRLVFGASEEPAS